MRTKLLLVAGLALLLGACSGKVNPPPPPLNKQLLTGKWTNSSEGLLVASYEFAEDGTLKMTIRGMTQPVPGHYNWSGDRSLSLEYKPTAEVQQAYKLAAQAFKQGVKDRINRGDLPDRAGPSILNTVRDELPDSETVKVGIAQKPPLLILSNEEGTSQTFDKVD
jgi:hypothetical protein